MQTDHTYNYNKDKINFLNNVKELVKLGKDKGDITCSNFQLIACEKYKDILNNILTTLEKIVKRKLDVDHVKYLLMVVYYSNELYPLNGYYTKTHVQQTAHDMIDKIMNFSQSNLSLLSPLCESVNNFIRMYTIHHVDETMLDISTLTDSLLEINTLYIKLDKTESVNFSNKKIMLNKLEKENIKITNELSKKGGYLGVKNVKNHMSILDNTICQLHYMDKLKKSYKGCKYNHIMILIPKIKNYLLTILPGYKKEINDKIGVNVHDIYDCIIQYIGTDHESLEASCLLSDDIDEVFGNNCFVKICNNYNLHDQIFSDFVGYNIEKIHEILHYIIEKTFFIQDEFEMGEMNGAECKSENISLDDNVYNLMMDIHRRLKKLENILCESDSSST